jgi:AcrR family transcriptional regulator
MTATLRAPLQDRSRRTLEAILDATEVLLEERPFEKISVPEIILKAGSSTGSFYARFASKDALLPALYARYHATLPPRVARIRRALARRPHALAEAARRIVDELAAVLEERKNLMRAMTLYARTRPEGIAPMIGERVALHEEIVDIFAPFKDEMREGWRDAVRAGLYLVASSLREAVLFPEAPFAVASRQPLARIKDTLCAMLVSFLAASREGQT